MENNIGQELIVIETKRTKIMNKINHILKAIINSFAFPIIMGICLFLKSIFFYYNTIMIRETLPIETILGTFVFIFVIVCIQNVLPNSARVYTTIITNFLISVLLFADNLYYLYSSNVLSVLQISNLQYGEEILTTIPKLIQFKHIIYFIDTIIVLILIFTKYWKIEKKSNLKMRYKIAKGLVGVVGVIVFCVVGNKYTSKANEDPYNRDLQIKKASIYGYHIADVANSMKIKNQAKYSNKEDMIKDYEILRNEYNEKYSQPNYNLEGSIKGKNIIVLQLESLQGFLVDATINGKEITPNLNKFLRENIRFSNMFMQSYSSTADSEFSSITSLYPMENGMSYSKYALNTYDDIFHIMNNNGYTTAYMHGNGGYFWNRQTVYKNMDVEHLEFEDNFEDISEHIMGYLSDELFYKQAVQKLKNYENPFFTYLVSASSHTSFTLDGLQDRNKINIDVGKYKDTFFGEYLESANYADYAFGLFIDALKEAGLYDDTVIILYGDHNGLEMYNEEMIDFLKQINPEINTVDLQLNYIRVLAGMKLPGITNLTIEKPISKLDVKPTICYLVGVDDNFSLGTNIFAKKDFICLNNEKIVTSRYYYNQYWYVIDTGEELDLNNISEDERELLDSYMNDMRYELDISKSLTINNLLK